MSAASSAIAYNVITVRKNKIYRVTTLPAFSTHFDPTPKKPRRLLTVRNSTDDESDTVTQIELPKGPPSLISALNVEKALRGIALTDVDHYRILGLQKGCSYDQVRVAYKNKVAAVTNQGLTEEELSNELERLKESNAILSSVQERRIYDWSLARAEKPDRYMWPHEVDITQVQFEGTPPPQEPEDTLPTRYVGYFMLSWLVLSFFLLAILSR